MEHCDTAEVLASLSTPMQFDSLSLTRRRFLQAAAIAGGALAVPSWLPGRANAAVSVPGILVNITMAGGNDGLNMVVPFQSGLYHDARNDLAVEESSVLPISDSRGLHPNLSFLHSKWQADQVAVLDGVGITTQNLSHFDSMSQWMSGKHDRSSWGTGWIGRYLDGFSDAYSGVHIGSSVPLLVRGFNKSALTIPSNSSEIINTTGLSPNDESQLMAVESFANGVSDSELVGSVALAQKQSIDVANSLAPSYEVALPEGNLESQLELCARLINADLGVRVFSVMYGSFDTHSNQKDEHNNLLQDFDNAINKFYSTLNPAFEGRTMLVTASEFGRRFEANASYGTDHGDANTLLAIGSGVKGGFYGELPSFSQLDQYGNLKPQVDFRDVYGTVLDGWLSADAAGIFGTATQDLGFLVSDPSDEVVEDDPVVIIPPPPSELPSVDIPKPKTDPYKNFLNLPPTKFHTFRAEITRLYSAAFLRLPDMEGLEYWVQLRNNEVPLATAADDFVSSTEFVRRYGALSNVNFIKLVYKNVLGRPADSGGLKHWLSVLSRGGTRGEVLVGFSESPEFISKSKKKVLAVHTKGPIARLYKAYFGRPADLSGLHYWTGTGFSLGRVSDAFAGSVEFEKKYGSLTNEQFVDLVYKNVLKRKPDRLGRKHWINMLNSGTSRGKVMLEFSESKEFIKRTKTLS